MWNYDEPDCEPEYECSACNGKENTLDTAKEFLESLVDMLYSKEALDLTDFEWKLDELCHYLNVKMIAGDLQIQRKQTPKTIHNILPIVDEWKTYNNKFLQQLTQTI